MPKLVEATASPWFVLLPPNRPHVGRNADGKRGPAQRRSNHSPGAYNREKVDILLLLYVGQRISRTLTTRTISTDVPAPRLAAAVRPQQLPRLNMNASVPRVPRSRCLNLLNHLCGSLHHPPRPSPWRQVLLESPRARQGRGSGNTKTQSRDPNQPASPPTDPTARPLVSLQVTQDPCPRLGKKGTESNNAHWVRHAAAGLLTKCLHLLPHQCRMQGI
jgi:hypothetical protein